MLINKNLVNNKLHYLQQRLQVIDDLYSQFRQSRQPLALPCLMSDNQQIPLLLEELVAELNDLKKGSLELGHHLVKVLNSSSPNDLGYQQLTGWIDRLKTLVFSLNYLEAKISAHCQVRRAEYQATTPYGGLPVRVIPFQRTEITTEWALDRQVIAS